MLTLRLLRPSDEMAFRKAVREFAETDPDWTFAFGFDADTDFSLYVERLQRQRQGLDLPEDWVPNTFLVAVVGRAIVGRVSLRHRLNPFSENVGGHVGYRVVPDHRRRGYATAMLRQTLPIARGVGVERLLVTCDEVNEASKRIIERNGGILEDARTQEGTAVRLLRYWIDLG